MPRPSACAPAQVYWQRRLWVRLSAQYYNTIKEYARLVEALCALGGQENGSNADRAHPAPYWGLVWRGGQDDDADEEEDEEADGEDDATFMLGEQQALGP